MLKQSLKSIFNQIASRFGPHTKNSPDGKLWILMYHRILPAEQAQQYNEEPGMYVTPETFNDHLNWLLEYMQPVKLSDWVENRAHKIPASGNAFAITFDDGWQDNYQYAYPVLKQHNIPATIFLVSSLMGTNKIFWPNRIAKLMPILSDFNHDHASIRSLRSKLNIDQDTDFNDVSSIIAIAKQYTDSEINDWLDVIEQQLALNDESRQLLNWQEIQEMIDSGIFELGAHTKYHTRLLETIAESTIEDEVVGSKKEIEDKSNQAVSLFCYPNGDFSQHTADLVSQHFAAAVTTQSGINQNTQNMHQLKRVGVHQDISSTRRDFLAQLACWR